METRTIGGVESIFPESYDKSMRSMGNYLFKLAAKMYAEGRLKLKCDQSQEPAPVIIPEEQHDAISERA